MGVEACAVAVVELSRTLLRSPPELWRELAGDRVALALGAVRVRATEAERELAWEAEGASGTARLEPAGWGTRVTLTAEVDERSARPGPDVFPRLRAAAPPAGPVEVQRRLEAVLDDLGTDHRKPFARA